MIKKYPSIIINRSGLKDGTQPLLYYHFKFSLKYEEAQRSSTLRQEKKVFKASTSQRN